MKSNLMIVALVSIFGFCFFNAEGMGIWHAELGKIENKADREAWVSLRNAKHKATKNYVIKSGTSSFIHYQLLLGEAIIVLVKDPNQHRNSSALYPINYSNPDLSNVGNDIIDIKIKKNRVIKFKVSRKGL